MIDDDLISFRRRCYQLTKQIPKGRVATYRLIAEALGGKAYRAVGTSMAKNPDIPATPCHRVIKSNGEIGQYAYGSDKKSQMLNAEGVPVKDNKVVDFEKYLHRFDKD
ncbi:MGMT family protein [Rickettsiales bacterium]|nr:MGMT family protein [Rickettsiales bacterium]